MRRGVSAQGDRWARIYSALVLAGFMAMTVLAPAGARAAENYEVTVERDLAVKMRDGVTLRADVCRPKADGKFPVY